MNLVFLLFLFAPGGQFQGKVVDVTTGEGVSFAEVRVLPLDITVVTDASGRFLVRDDRLKETVTVSVSRVGYEEKVWDNVPRKTDRVFYLFPKAIPVAGVTSVASRLTRKVFAAQPVSVVENEPNEPAGGLDAGGIVNRTAGVQINDYGNLTMVMLRGANSEQTVVMLDGAKLNTSLNNLADISLIPPVFVRTVELMRGGASALYGANPMGGVININTPRVERRGAKLGFGLGAFGRRYGSTVISFPGTINLLFAGGLVRAENNWSYRDPSDSLRKRNNNDLFRADGLFKCQTKFWGRHYLSLAGVLNSSQRGSPGPISFPSDSARLRDNTLLTILGYDFLESERSRLSSRFSHQRTWQNYYNPDPYFPANDTHQVYQTGLSLNQWLGATDWLTGNLGLDFFLEQAKSTRVGDPSRVTNAVYAEAGISGEGWNLKPAFRYDLMLNRGMSDEEKIRKSYGSFSPRVSFVVSRWSPLSFYLGASRSFRAPTFNELWWPNEPWSAGNPSLVPEFGTGIDGGAGLDLAGIGRVRLGVYQSQFTNLIEWLPDTSFRYQPVNVASATISGVELETGVNLLWMGFNWNTTYQRCQAEGKDLPYRPRLSTSGDFWIGYPRDEKEPVIKLSLRGSAITRRYTNKENTDTLPGWVLLDAGLTFDPVRLLTRSGVGHCRVGFGCKNLLDTQYQEIKGYPLPGRNIYLEMGIGI